MDVRADVNCFVAMKRKSVCVSLPSTLNNAGHIVSAHCRLATSWVDVYRWGLGVEAEGLGVMKPYRKAFVFCPPSLLFSQESQTAFLLALLWWLPRVVHFLANGRPGFLYVTRGFYGNMAWLQRERNRFGYEYWAKFHSWHAAYCLVAKVTTHTM